MFTETKRRRPTSQQPRTKSNFRSIDVPKHDAFFNQSSLFFLLLCTWGITWSGFHFWRHSGGRHGNRGPISIFGPIFKVEDRSEDPDLRVAEGSWWPEGGSEEEVPGGGSSSILPADKMEDGRVLRSSCLEGGRWGEVLRSSEEEVPPSLPSSARSSTHSSGPKIEDGWGVFDLRLRRSKVEDGGGFFDLRVRRSKMGGVLDMRTRRTKTPPFFEEPPLLSSFFGSENRRTPPSSIFRAEDWFEDRRGPRGATWKVDPWPAGPLRTASRRPAALPPCPIAPPRSVCLNPLRLVPASPRPAPRCPTLSALLVRCLGLGFDK